MNKSSNLSKHSPIPRVCNAKNFPEGHCGKKRSNRETGTSKKVEN
jgi:hypothetical protein